MNWTKRDLVVAALLPVCPLLGCESGLSAAITATSARPLPVETLILRRERRRPQVRVIAELQAHRRALLRARIAATVERVSVQIGARVDRQTLLVKLGDRALGLQLSAARARRRSSSASVWRARRQRRRIRKLVRAGALPRAELDRATSALRHARAERRVHHADLGVAGAQRQVRAPFAGRVADVSVNRGDEVRVGQPLVSVVDITRLRARLGLAAEAADGVRVGDPCSVRVAGYAPQGHAIQPHMARVLAVGVVMDPRTRRVPVEIEIDNHQGKLRAGMLTEATLFVGGAEDVLVMPERALVWHFDVPYAFVVKQGLAQRHRLQLTGRRWGSSVEVSAGVAAGQSLVVVGQHRLSERAAVQVVEPEPKKAL